jgi:exosome complex RNA-binding protein Rrp42 (RNase PH superfamily)
MLVTFLKGKICGVEKTGVSAIDTKTFFAMIHAAKDIAATMLKHVETVPFETILFTIL